MRHGSPDGTVVGVLGTLGARLVWDGMFDGELVGTHADIPVETYAGILDGSLVGTSEGTVIGSVVGA